MGRILLITITLVSLQYCSAQEFLPISYLPLRGNAEETAVQDNYAFIAAANIGLRILDISDRANPREVGHLILPQQDVDAVAVSGDYAYVGTHVIGGDIEFYPPRLQIIEIADPANPQLVGFVNVPDYIFDIEINNGYAYVCASDSGFFVADIASPDNPVISDRYDETLWMADAVLEDTIAFFAAGFDGLKVYDISDPEQLIEIAALPSRHYYSHLSKSGAFIAATEGDSGLAIIDVADPFAPVVRGTMLPESEFERFRAVSLRGDVLYAASSSALKIIDVSDPEEPEQVYSHYGYFYVKEILLDENRLFLSAGGVGLSIVDVEDISQPELLSQFAVAAERVNGLRIDDDYAYVATTRRGLIIVGLTGSMYLEEASVSPLAEYLRDVLIEDSFAYVAADTGLFVLNIVDPCNPVEIAFLPLDIGYGNEVAKYGDYLYYGHSQGISIIDVEDPQIPQVAGLVQTEHSVGGIDIADGFAYVAHSAMVGSLEIFDLTNPASPQSVGSCASMDWAHGVTVMGDIAAMAVDYAGMQLFDVSNPSSPASISLTNLGGSSITNTIASAGSYVYTSGQYQKIDVIDIRDPQNPVIAGRSAYYLEGTEIEVSQDGRTIYTGDDDRFSAWDCSDILTPVNASASIPASIGFEVFPNPFNSVATISFELPATADVNLGLYNVNGQLVRQLIDGRTAVGNHRISLEANELPSGIYFCSLKTSSNHLTRKIVLLR